MGFHFVLTRTNSRIGFQVNEQKKKSGGELSYTVAATFQALR